MPLLLGVVLDTAPDTLGPLDDDSVASTPVVVGPLEPDVVGGSLEPDGVDSEIKVDCVCCCSKRRLAELSNLSPEPGKPGTSPIPLVAPLSMLSARNTRAIRSTSTEASIPCD